MRTLIKLALAAAAVAVLPSAASAAVTITISQVGANVVATTTGTLSLTGLTVAGNYGLSYGISPVTPYVATGTPAGATVTGYTGFAGTGTFGSSNTFTSASSGAGIPFAFNGNSGVPYVFVAQGFTSGGSVAGSTTYDNTTLAAMGLTAQTLTYRSSGDTLTVVIGGNVTPSVPEPATWAMMMLGFGALGFSLRRKMNVQARIRFA